MNIKIKTLRRFNNLIGKRFGNLIVTTGPLDVINEKEWSKKQRKWLCKCDCGNEVIRVTNQLNKGAATSCGCLSKKRVVEMNTKDCRPFEWIYNNLLRCAKNNHKEIGLTFEDFLEFTKITTCHYCGDLIEWKSRGKKGANSAYYLDRKDNTKGYFKDNCVVCCSLCNLTKHNQFTYNEMILLGKTINEIKRQRLDQSLKPVIISM